MLRIAVLLAGLGAALLCADRQIASGDELLVNGGFEAGTTGWDAAYGELTTVSSPVHTGSASGRLAGDPLPDVVHQWVDVAPDQPYEFSGWILPDDPNIVKVSLRIRWFDDEGSPISPVESPWLAGANGSFRFVTTGPHVSPPQAHRAWLNIWVQPSGPFQLYLDDFSFTGSPPPSPTATATPFPTPAPTPTPSPEPSAAPTTTPAPPPPEPTTTPRPPEPAVFPSLVNGGFEDAREDGSPYGWHNVGGALSASQTLRAEGERSAALASDTASTKWIYETISVQGEAYYRLQALALKNDPGVREVLLRIAWYDTTDGSGSQIGTADSEPLADDSPRFVALDTGPVQAPPQARSARVRLLLRPVSPASAVAYFDDVRFGPSDAPGSVAVDGTPPTPPTTDDGAGGGGEDIGPAAEPPVFPSLVNGGFEEAREDGSPYGWHNVGGALSASQTLRAEGERSAALASDTASTKWVYETLSVQGEAYYRLQALALKNDPGVREVLLRISWYDTTDGSGSQIGTADSEPLADDSPRFVALDTGPAQAPPQARSARVRLLLRPVSPASAVVYFDDVRFGKADAPGREDADPPANPLASQDGGGAGDPDGVSLGAWAKGTTLANERSAPQPPQPTPDGGGRLLWPLLLALGVSAAALATVAGHAWWRGRLAERNGGNL